MRRRRTLWVGAAPYALPADVAEAIAQLAGETTLPARPTGLRVTLEPPLVQLRTLRGLPPVRRGALRQLVALQAGRFFRRNGKPLVTDAAWERRRRGYDRVARAAAVEEPWVEAIVGGALAAGLRLEGITPAGEDKGDTLELRSPTERARRRRAEWLAVRRLAVVAALLWVVAGGVVGSRIYREGRRVERELAALDASIKAVIAARRQLGEAAHTVETVERAERERSLLLARLAAILGELPDSAYLTSLSIDTAGQGTLTGAAKRAAEVVASFDRAAVVDAPTLVGPTVREVTTGREWERFTIRLGRGGER